jgi:hypothetical protein
VQGKHPGGAGQAPGEEQGKHQKGLISKKIKLISINPTKSTIGRKPKSSR